MKTLMENAYVTDVNKGFPQILTHNHCENNKTLAHTQPLCCHIQPLHHDPYNTVLVNRCETVLGNRLGAQIYKGFPHKIGRPKNAKTHTTTGNNTIVVTLRNIYT